MSAQAATTHTHTAGIPTGEATRVGYVRRTGQPYLFNRGRNRYGSTGLKPLVQRLSPGQLERRQLKREDRATFRATVGKYLAMLIIDGQQRVKREATFLGRLKYLFLGR